MGECVIRRAGPADAAQIYYLTKDLHAVSRYRHIPIDDAKIKRLICHVVGSPHQFCWVSERDGQIHGMLLGYVDEILWSRKKEAHDLWFYVDEKGRGDGAKLARKFISWAEERGVALLGLSVSAGIDDTRAEALYRRLGLERQVSVFARFGGKSDEQSAEEDRQGHQEGLQACR